LKNPVKKSYSTLLFAFISFFLGLFLFFFSQRLLVLQYVFLEIVFVEEKFKKLFTF